MEIKMDSVVVLDLDDTLYKETNYQKSGFDAVLAYLESLYGESVLGFARQVNPDFNGDWMAELCLKLNFSPSFKESLLWVYRLHRPSIELSLDVKKTLDELSANNVLCILTDGRSITQRQKVSALGLTYLPIYISEEYGSSKPSPLGFETIMRDYPAIRYFYVGDNLLKDFAAPNSLGWTSICLRDDGDNIHSQDVCNLSASQMPAIWIDSLRELLVHI